MKIQLFYFEGCPSFQEAISNLKSVLDERGIDDDIDLVYVRSPDHAQEVNFQGSPSIVIDGIDIEQKDDLAFFGCRIYQIDEKLTGTPSIQFIRDKFDELAIGNSN